MRAAPTPQPLHFTLLCGLVLSCCCSPWLPVSAGSQIPGLLPFGYFIFVLLTVEKVFLEESWDVPLIYKLSYQHPWKRIGK